MKILLHAILLTLFVASTIILVSMHEPESLRVGVVEYDVRVINGFKNNSSLPLVIWCRTSKGDDLGGRALQEGDDYSWIVRTTANFFFRDTTRYICTMKWENMKKKFDAFKVSRDARRCSLLKRCSWLVTEDGFYFSEDEVNWKRDFSWERE